VLYLCQFRVENALELLINPSAIREAEQAFLEDRRIDFQQPRVGIGPENYRRPFGEIENGWINPPRVRIEDPPIGAPPPRPSSRPSGPFIETRDVWTGSPRGRRIEDPPKAPPPRPGSSLSGRTIANPPPRPQSRPSGPFIGTQDVRTGPTRGRRIGDIPNPPPGRRIEGQPRASSRQSGIIRRMQERYGFDEGTVVALLYEEANGNWDSLERIYLP
jgi:hypothetical protein